MHPFPRRPKADTCADHQQRCGKEDPGSEITVEPMSEYETEQSWHHDRPAENAYLAQAGAERRLGFLSSRAFALRGLPGSMFHAIGRGRPGGSAVY